MLGYVWSFSAAGLARLAQGCPKLETIDLADDYDHTSLTAATARTRTASCRAWAARRRGLAWPRGDRHRHHRARFGCSPKDINLGYCGPISDATLAALAGCPTLAALNISSLGKAAASRCGLPQLSPAALDPVLERCPVLAALTLSACGAIVDDATLRRIGQYTPWAAPSRHRWVPQGNHCRDRSARC